MRKRLFRVKSTRRRIAVVIDVSFDHASDGRFQMDRVWRSRQLDRNAPITSAILNQRRVASTISVEVTECTLWRRLRNKRRERFVRLPQSEVSVERAGSLGRHRAIIAATRRGVRPAVAAVVCCATARRSLDDGTRECPAHKTFVNAPTSSGRVVWRRRTQVVVASVRPLLVS